ncbi:hypothetical protein J2T60_000763 [Natronospira proteinivora]|uniref:Uncharacterized protein n=1 Tax=Natronospira proteinivora TaxID=1807133 RepID=A0ABT1G8Z4_9GAMM|nr:hypothetical protein [Natronospira proteinivora]MCP1726798.1 hypothetical protein [Natronospira proteinivora]
MTETEQQQDALLAMADADAATKTRPWWGDYPMDPEQRGMSWHIGPLRLQARWWPQEWRLAWHYGDDPLDTSVEHAGLDDIEAFPDMTLARYALGKAPSCLRLVPRVADRSVVVRPDIPLYVPPGEETVIHVSTSVWVQVQAVEGEKVVALGEMPGYRPSDSFFGANTREGDVCYASRSLARLRMEDVVQRPHRVLTPVTVRNKGEDSLLIERINVPLPILTLYASANHQLWTQPLTLERGRDGKEGALKLEEMRLPASMQVRVLSEPREVPDKQGLFRALDRLLG